MEASDPECVVDPSLGAGSALGSPAPGRCSGPARLSLRAYPWCRLTIDGEDVGDTPVMGLTVLAGERELRCVNEDAGIDCDLGPRVYLPQLSLPDVCTKLLNLSVVIKTNPAAAEHQHR